MDYSTKLNLIQYYAQRSTDELMQDKIKIGEYLKFTKIANLSDIKECITIINKEIKSRLK